MAKINSGRAVLRGLTSLVLFVSATTQAWCQTYNVGDRVEVDDTGMNCWESGVVMPFKPGDITDGVYRVKKDPPHQSRDPGGDYAQTIHMRPSSKARAAPSSAASSASSGSNAPAQSFATPHRAYTGQPRTYSSQSSSSASTSASAAPLAPVAKASGGALNPAMAGGVPMIPGTGWMIMGIQMKGEPPKTPKSFGQSLSFCFNGSWSNTRYDLAAGPMGSYTVQGSNLKMISSLDNSVYLGGPMTWRAADQMLIVDSGTAYWYLQLTSLNACGGK